MARVDDAPPIEIIEQRIAALHDQLQKYDGELFLVVTRKWEDNIHTTFPEPSFSYRTIGDSYRPFPNRDQQHLVIKEYLGVAKEPFVEANGCITLFTTAWVEDAPSLRGFVREGNMGPWLPYLGARDLDRTLRAPSEGVFRVDSGVSPGTALEVIVGNDAVTQFYIDKARFGQANQAERELLRELEVYYQDEFKQRLEHRQGGYFSIEPLRRFHLMQLTLGKVFVSPREHGEQIAREFNEILIKDEDKLFERISELLSGPRDGDQFKREIVFRLGEAIDLGMHQHRVDKVYEIRPGIKAHVYTNEVIRELCALYEVPLPEDQSPVVDNT